jgi:hypothetical protein
MSKDIVYWTMCNGKKISVDDMDIDHLRNTLKMILRKVKPESVRLNGEIAQLFINEMEPEDIGFDPVWDIYMK